MFSLARAFAYTRFLEDEVARLRLEVREWQDKTLERRGFTPLGVREPEPDNTQPGFTGHAFDLRPPFARAQAEWEAEDERAAKLSEEQKQRLRGAAEEALSN